MQRSDSPLFDHLMSGYDRAFVLPDERKELDGFRACPAINSQSRKRFGRTHCDLVMTIDDGLTGSWIR